MAWQQTGNTESNAGQNQWYHEALLSYTELTHLSLDKMAAFLQTIFSDAFSWMKSFFILIKISLKFVPKDLTNNNKALV